MKRKETTGKVEPLPKYLEEEKFTLQSAISKFVSYHDIPLELVLKLDQAPLSYVSPWTYTFDLQGSKTVANKGVHDKRQKPATFTVAYQVHFLFIQLIYRGKTKCIISKYDFPSSFDVTFFLNYWSNHKKRVRLFEKTFFPYLKAKQEELGYPKEYYSLIVMDTFKGQGNSEIRALYLKNDCNLVIAQQVPAPWYFYQSKSEEAHLS